MENQELKDYSSERLSGIYKDEDYKGLLFTVISMEFMEFLSVIPISKLKSDFLIKSKLNKIDISDITLWDLDKIISIIIDTKIVCDKVLNECIVRFNNTSKIRVLDYKFEVKLSRWEKDVLKKGRPFRGGYGILDTYIAQAYKLGYIKDISTAFNMYVIYKIMDYDPNCLISDLTSYLLGNTNLDKLKYLTSLDKEDNI